MLDDVIAAKRNLVKKGVIRNDDLEENEKGLLTLMIESENRDEGSLSDEELKACNIYEPESSDNVLLYELILICLFIEQLVHLLFR